MSAPPPSSAPLPISSIPVPQLRSQQRRHRPQDPSVALSKALSRVLRHSAAAAGLQVRPDGFVDANAVLALLPFAGVTGDQHRAIVTNCPKQRFALREDDDGTLLVRANQVRACLNSSHYALRRAANRHDLLR
jgi:RNA:NAD 2'-phosphotransferase (TPT1/KptA family)